jgi:hypothetical protein
MKNIEESQVLKDRIIEILLELRDLENGTQEDPCMSGMDFDDLVSHNNELELGLYGLIDDLKMMLNV